MCMPIEDGSKMLENIISEVTTRKDRPKQKAARLLLWGTPLTEAGFVDMIESLNANVVMDDICTGTRHFWDDVEIEAEPLDGIAKRYLEKIKCQRTFRESAGSFEKEMEIRFGYLKDYAKEWKVDGVILQSVKYCDTHGYEVPAVKKYFDKMGIPSLYLEHEYSMIAEAPLKNRIEAFLELLE